MANFIEKILEEKSRGTESEVFYTQWLLAKDYIPKVHSVIVRIFPHYSLHDAWNSGSQNLRNGSGEVSNSYDGSSFVMQ